MKARVFIIMTFLLLGVNAKATNAKPASQDAQAAAPAGKVSTQKPPAKTHEEPATKEKTQPPPTDAHGTAAVTVPARTDRYVHHWLEFPSLRGLGLKNQEITEIKPKFGRVTVLVFLASWCLPCQQQIRSLRQLEEKYREHYTDFIFVFSHDTEADAKGFSRVYNLGDNTLIASAEALEIFHQPELPSFYVADRYQWLILRRINTQEADLKELDNFLDLHTAM